VLILIRRLGSREFVESMVVRLFWLGEIGPDLFPGFFQVDLAPYILKFLRRDGSTCLRVYGSLMSADGILCTVLLLFASVLPLLQSMETASYVQRAEEHAKKIAKHDTVIGLVVNFSMDFPTHWQVVLALSMVVFQVCQSLHSCGMLSPEDFEGKLPQHHIDWRSNGWLTLIAWQALGPLLSSLSLELWTYSR
jgi:hypothetical protein